MTIQQVVLVGLGAVLEKFVHDRGVVRANAEDIQHRTRDVEVEIDVEEVVDDSR